MSYIHSTDRPHPPFRLNSSSLEPAGGLLASMGKVIAERVLAFPALNAVHRRATASGDERPFCERALAALDVRLDVSDDDLARIPRNGPLLVVANHPFGGLDGLALLTLIKRVRPDVRILANHLLAMIPELRDQSVFVDPYGGDGAVARNLGSMRAAMRFIRGGGALAVFPAGEVSGPDPRTGEVADIGWNPFIARLIRGGETSVVPVFFAGRNSALFQWAGRLHSRLRSLLLPRELLRQRGRRLDVRIGQPITPSKLKQFESDEELAAYLRVRTYVLAGRAVKQGSVEAVPAKAVRTGDAIAVTESADLVAAEIEALPPENQLASSGALRVVIGHAYQFRTTLREIGRLREITFRRVGEGTGRPRDLDTFDQHYLHLLVWHSQRREIVGSYRLGLTDQILGNRGKAGLYTSTLFDFKDELLKQISPAIELGRSFVRPEYQKDYAPLMLLWRGIALFVSRNPQYRRLFGPVSISNEYQSLSRQILVAFLRQNVLAPDLAKWVIPRNPPKHWPGRAWSSRLAATTVKTIEVVDELVGEIETERAGMPVLLRQYLRLNAKLLGFNVDPEFGDVLDGLMLVDLLDVDRAILTRYMGRENLAALYGFHGRQA